MEIVGSFKRLLKVNVEMALHYKSQFSLQSAKGAQYDSQGQVPSGARRVAPGRPSNFRRVGRKSFGGVMSLRPRRLQPVQVA